MRGWAGVRPDLAKNVPGDRKIAPTTLGTAPRVLARACADNDCIRAAIGLMASHMRGKLFDRRPRVGYRTSQQRLQLSRFRVREVPDALRKECPLLPGQRQGIYEGRQLVLAGHVGEPGDACRYFIR